MATPLADPADAGRRGPRPTRDADLRAAQRTAAAMTAVGGLLLLAALATGDQRLEILLVIIGGMTAGVGLLTLVYGRVRESAARSRSRPQR
ncbi:hypothetical protein BH23ACT8_BH23ACT8_25870 [soil metagenome]